MFINDGDPFETEAVGRAGALQGRNDRSGGSLGTTLWAIETLALAGKFLLPGPESNGAGGGSARIDNDLVAEVDHSCYGRTLSTVTERWRGYGVCWSGGYGGRHGEWRDAKRRGLLGARRSGWLSTRRGGWRSAKLRGWLDRG